MDVELMHGNCLEVMRGFDDAIIDLTVTSPPYDHLRMYNGFTFDFLGIARELFRVTKPGGVVVWVVGDETKNGSESGTSFRQAIHFQEIGFNLHDTMIYEKASPALPDNVRYLQCFEFMFVLSKGKPKTVNLLKDRKNTFTEKWGSKSVREADGELSNRRNRKSDEYGRRFNIWRFNTGHGFTAEEEYAFEHPAMFPEALARDHILSWSNPGDLILDPMMGSGTTGKMAVKLQRNFTGIESDERYFSIAKRRINNARLPPALFDTDKYVLKEC